MRTERTSPATRTGRRGTTSSMRGRTRAAGTRSPASRGRARRPAWSAGRRTSSAPRRSLHRSRTSRTEAGPQVQRDRWHAVRADASRPYSSPPAARCPSSRSRSCWPRLGACSGSDDEPKAKVKAAHDDDHHDHNRPTCQDARARRGRRGSRERRPRRGARRRHQAGRARRDPAVRRHRGARPARRRARSATGYDGAVRQLGVQASATGADRAALTDEGVGGRDRSREPERVTRADRRGRRRRRHAAVRRDDVHARREAADRIAARSRCTATIELTFAPGGPTPWPITAYRVERRRATRRRPRRRPPSAQSGDHDDGDALRDPASSLIGSLAALTTIRARIARGLTAAWLAGVHVPFASGATYLRIEKLAPLARDRAGAPDRDRSSCCSSATTPGPASAAHAATRCTCSA